MTRFLLIRHAATDSVGKRLSGRIAGVPLNEEGRGQAVQLAQNLRGLPVTAVYSSPLERTTETAGYVAEAVQQSVLPNEDFLEMNFGDWTNADFSELGKNEVFGRFNSFRSVTRVPNGETMLEAQLRMVQGIEKLCDKHPDETVAIVSHSDMIKAALSYYAGIHLDLFQRIEISPASVSIIELGGDYVSIRLINFTGRLAF